MHLHDSSASPYYWPCREKLPLYSPVQTEVGDGLEQQDKDQEHGFQKDPEYSPFCICEQR